MRNRSLVILSLLVCWPMGLLVAEDVPSEAQRHLNRAIAAIEMAGGGNAAEYDDAITELKAASALAPNWEIPYYNLASISAKLQRYQDAIDYYKKYLAAAPNAKDAAQVRTELDKLEFKLEKLNKLNDLSGEWVFAWLDESFNSINVPVNVAVTDGNDFSASSGVFDANSAKVMQHLVGAVAPFEKRDKGQTSFTVKGKIKGNEIKGLLEMAAYKEKSSGCQVSPAVCELFDSKVTTDAVNGKPVIVLTFNRPIYQVDYTDIFFGVKPCTGVKVLGHEKTSVTLFRVQ